MELSEEIMKRVMRESLGEDVLPVTKLLQDNEELSEIKLAKLLKIEVNETRRSLYKLHHENLVSFKKKRDDETGWYTYYWSLNNNRMEKMIERVSRNVQEKINNRLEKEKSNQFFVCSDRCVRLDHHTAMLYNFKCPECGQVLKLEDNSRRIQNLTDSLREIETLFNIQTNS